MIYDRPFFCSWVEQPAGGFVCSKCGGLSDVRSVRRCKADRQPGESNVALRSEGECLLCAHNRGVREVRSVDCCGGKKTSHKIFGCGVHGKCQLGEVVPGIQVCEHMPRMAAMMDKLVPIRSMVGATGSHYSFQCMTDRKSTRLNSSHTDISRMPSSA